VLACSINHFGVARSQAFAKADVLVIVGTPFDFRMGYGKRISVPTLVQIDMDYRTVGKNRDLTLGIVGDPGAVLVIDDREEFSDPSLFGEGIACRRGPFREALFEFPIDQDTYVALVGRGHIVDGKALLSCLNSPAAYIGMMGSHYHLFRLIYLYSLLNKVSYTLRRRKLFTIQLCESIQCSCLG